VTGDEVLCHFISALRRLIVFLVSDTPIRNDRNNGFRGTDYERPFKQYEVILFPDFLIFPSFLKFCIFLSSCRKYIFQSDSSLFKSPARTFGVRTRNTNSR
jgi:hypothetical protein